MLKPDVVGEKCLYLNPTVVDFTSADLAAIDNLNSVTELYPYAYTATVAEHYDSMNISILGQNIETSRKVAFGVFLTPDNDKGNILFQVNGSMYGWSATNFVGGFYFFGRKATDDTVVSSKLAPANLLAEYMILPSVGTLAINSVGMSCRQEIFGLCDTAKFVYCFGFVLINSQAGNTAVSAFRANITIRKYVDQLDIYRPIR